MALINKHGTIILGIDIHFTTLPPFNPLHPFIGLVFDPMDYIPFIGATINVNGLRRGLTDTSGMLVIIKHIPIASGLFAEAPLIAHQSVNFFGSHNTFGEGRMMSPTTYMKMTCNDIGIPLSGHAGEKFKPKFSLFAPTSFSIPLPIGAPVNLGGPFVPDLMGAMINLAFSYGFSALLKRAGKLAKKIKGRAVEELEASASKKEGIKFCENDPVDMVTGAVWYPGCDFELPGMLPLRWQRNWYSDSRRNGLLGHGTSCIFDSILQRMGNDELALLLPDGRATAFALPLPNETDYNRAEQLTLTNAGDHFTVFFHQQRHSYRYTAHPTKPGCWRLVEIRSEQKYAITAHYEGLTLVHITDSAGRMLPVTTDVEGRITAIHAEGVLQVSYGYNEAGDLCTIADAMHQVTRMVYEQHKMIQKTDRNGQSFYWKYNGNRCIHTWGDGGIFESFISYHDGYNVNRSTTGKVTTYHYDGEGFCTQITDALGHSQYYDYTPWGELYRNIDEEANMTGYSYDERGNCIRISAPDGSERRYVYDENDRIILYTDGEGNSTVRSYNEYGQLDTLIEPNNAISSFAYDDHRRLCSVTDNNHDVTRLRYDAQDNLAEIEMPDHSVTRWDYDKLGRCIRRVNPMGGVQSIIYDIMARPTRIQQPDGNIVWLDYDAYGEVLHARDSQHDVTYAYNALGKLTMRSEKNTTLRYHYNNAGQLLTIINQHQEQYRMERDLVGRIVRVTDFDGSEKCYSRQDNGWVKKIERPGGRHTLYEYDGAGRVIRMEYEDGGWETFQYNKNGQMIAANNAYGAITMQRDIQGNIVEEHALVNGRTYTVQSTYNRLSRRVGIQSSLQVDISLNYAGTGHLQGMTAQQADVGWDMNLAYNALGQETERWLPGGVRSYMEYDHAGHIMRQTVSKDRRETRKRCYSWDANDRLVTMVNDLTNGVVNYGHDDFGSLAFATYEDGTKQYKSPDATDNVFRSPEHRDRVYESGGRLRTEQEWQCQYDAEGNLMSRSNGIVSWHYQWYSNRCLRSVTRPDGAIVSFEYDALGRRIAKICSQEITRWLWDGNRPFQEWSYPLPDRPQMQVDEWGDLQVSHPEPAHAVTTWIFKEGSYAPCAKLQDDKAYSIVTDYLGTPVQMFDAAGTLTWDVELDVYGKIRTLTKGNSSDCPYRYQGQYEDAETGLYYNRFRYYSPESGRYISKDPIAIAGGLNQYAYVHDVNSWVDVSGLMPAVTNTVDFTGHPDLYQGAGDNIVKIKMTGDRGSDFTRAYKEAGINRKDAFGYTWHHVADFDPATGECTMQLVKTPTHVASYPHQGSAGQFADHFGVEYDTFEAKMKAYEQGWRDEPKRREPTAKPCS